MILGFAITLIGLGMPEVIAVVAGIPLLLLAAFLILSIDCIAIDKLNNNLYLYRDYYFTTWGKNIPIREFECVSIYCYIEPARYNPKLVAITQYKVFSIYLVDKSGRKLLLKEFGNINDAKKLQVIIANRTKLQLTTEPLAES